VTDEHSREPYDGEPDVNRLAAYLEGRLDPVERARVTEHLSRCVECRRVVAAFARGSTSRERTWRTAAAPWLALAAVLTIATIAGLRFFTAGPQPFDRPPAASGPPPTRTAAPPETSAPPVVTEPPPSAGRSQATKRGGTRAIGGKIFRLEAGEWIDSAYDPVALLPVVDVEGDAARRATIDRAPALAPFAALGPRVTVAYDGRVYKFHPPEP